MDQTRILNTEWCETTKKCITTDAYFLFFFLFPFYNILVGVQILLDVCMPVYANHISVKITRTTSYYSIHSSINYPHITASITHQAKTTKITPIKPRAVSLQFCLITFRSWKRVQNGRSHSKYTYMPSLFIL